ncbi:MAG: hypothetical protein ACXVFW_05560 [Blastococcus sp.]
MTAVAAAVVAIVSAAPAQAAPPLAGSGTGLFTADQVTSARNAGGNRIVERRLEGSMSGTLTGSISEEVRGVVHPDGTVTFQGTLVFVGTVDGCGTGTLTARLQGSGQAVPPVTDATVTVIGQAANTVPVTGHGTVLQSGPDLSYSIRYSCH